MSEVTSKARKQRSIGWWIFRVMAGYELAILCLDVGVRLPEVGDEEGFRPLKLLGLLDDRALHQCEAVV